LCVMWKGKRKALLEQQKHTVGGNIYSHLFTVEGAL
jgi:hypothetical protein